MYKQDLEEVAKAIGVTGSKHISKLNIARDIGEKLANSRTTDVDLSAINFGDKSSDDILNLCRMAYTVDMLLGHEDPYT